LQIVRVRYMPTHSAATSVGSKSVRTLVNSAKITEAPPWRRMLLVGIVQ